MARKTQPHGTIAAARRHERRGEQLCDPCRTARSEHNAAQHRRRRALADERPAAVAKLPAGLTEIPEPWVGWSRHIVTRPAETYSPRSDEGVLVRRRWTVRWTPNYGPARDAVDRAVNAWLNDEPGAADILLTMPRAWRVRALAMLGYDTSTHRDLVHSAVVKSLTQVWTTAIDFPDADATCPEPMPADPDHPWPLTRTEEVTDLRVEEGAIEDAPDNWVVSTSEGVIVRAPAGTPIPDGWTDAAGEIPAVPFRFADSYAAANAELALRSSANTTIVLVERDGVTHVSRGFGGATIDLGPWSDVEAGITAAVSDIADDVAGLSWAGRPEVKIVRSTGRSWDDYIETATLVETRTVGG